MGIILPKLLIVDGNNWFRRRAESCTTGTPVRDCFNEILRQSCPVLVVWDGYKSLTTRRAIYPEYKMKRNKPGETFYDSQKLFQNILEFSAAIQIRVDGYEGDDVIAALADRYRHSCNVFISSNDGDLWQLGLPMDKEKFSEAPHRVALYKTVVGDASDNIPGWVGFGKTSWAKLTDPQKDMIQQIITSPREMKPEEISEKVADFCPPKALKWFIDPENQKKLKVYYKIINFIPIEWGKIEAAMKPGLNRPDLAEPILREYLL